MDASPFLYSDRIYKWLENAMDYGITEAEFWAMTFAEIDRAIEAKKRAEQRKAQFDYVLADLIGHSVARVHNSANKMPTLAEAYPTLFDKQEEEKKIQEQKEQLSAIRFKLFAKSFNTRLKEVSNKDE